MADSSYSFSLTTFSPSGKLGQIDHAIAAVGQGSTSLAIKATNGVVLATEKKMASPLMDASSIQKISALDDHIGLIYSGMGSDARVLVASGRKQCRVYRTTYDEPIPVGQIVRHLASVMQEYTQSGGVRPFGVSLLVCGYDTTGPHLFQVDPSGSYWAWKASAIGKNMVNAKTFLEKRYTQDIELEDAIHTALLTLKEGYDGKMASDNIELGVVNDKGQFKVLSPSEVKDYLDEVL
jgi:20S proteasome subunit alpha 2